MKYFYICSWGGCGSTIITKYLKNFGVCFHIHSKRPPNNLTYVGNKLHHEIFTKDYVISDELKNINHTYIEWFSDEEIANEELNNNEYYVLFVFKNPIKSIYSRFLIPDHLNHIKCDHNIKIKDVIEKKNDLYGIKEFYANYTKKNININYDIHCINYELFFDKIEEFNNYFGLDNKPELYPIKKETTYNYGYENELKQIYHNLIDEIESQDFITTIKKKI